MKKRIVLNGMIQAALMASCVSVAWAEAGSIAVGNMDLVPQLKIGESHNDNIFSQEKQASIKSSWITTISPSLTLLADDGANQYELGYNLSQKIYQQSHDDDVLDNFLNFNANLGLSRKLTTDFYVNYNLTHDPRGSTFTGGVGGTVAVPDAYHETIVGGSLDYGSNAHMIVSGEYSNKRYTNNRTRTIARDMDAAKAGLEFDYDLTGKTSAVLEARYKQFNYKFQSATVNLDSSEQKYFTGLNWEATAKTSGRARIGYTKKNFKKVSTQDVGFFSWELGVEWLPMSYSSWVLETSLTPVETDGTGSSIKNKSVNLSWNHAWSERLNHAISLGYTTGSYQGNSTRVDKTTTASVSVSYQMLRWLAIEPSYHYSNRSSNAVNSSYRANVWAIDFIGTL